MRKMRKTPSQPGQWFRDNHGDLWSYQKGYEAALRDIKMQLPRDVMSLLDLALRGAQDDQATFDDVEEKRYIKIMSTIAEII